MKNFIKKITLGGTLLIMGLNINAQAQAGVLGNKNFKLINIQEEFKLIKPIGLVWVNP